MEPVGSGVLYYRHIFCFWEMALAKLAERRPAVCRKRKVLARPLACAKTHRPRASCPTQVQRENPWTPAACCGKPGHGSALLFLLNRAAFVGERGWKVTLEGGRKVANRWSEEVWRQGYSVGEAFDVRSRRGGGRRRVEVLFSGSKGAGKRSSRWKRSVRPCG